MADRILKVSTTSTGHLQTITRLAIRRLVSISTLGHRVGTAVSRLCSTSSNHHPDLKATVVPRDRGIV
jgi:hypothetical protein